MKFQSEDQEATIYPGDYIFADLNGVICIPKSLAESVVQMIASQVEAENRIALDLKLGRTFSEASKEHRASVVIPKSSSFR